MIYAIIHITVASAIAITLAMPGERGRNLAKSLTINDVARCWKTNMANHLLKKSRLWFVGPFLSLYVAAEGPG